MKTSTAQRKIYSKSPSSVQVPTVNSSSSLLATGMPALPIRSQDLNLMSSFGGKQDGTLQQKTEMHAQSHHHSMSQLQQQQQQNHIVIPSLQMSLKDVDSHMSPPSSANRGPTSASVMGLPTGASVMAPQGHTSFHNIGSQHQLSFHDQSASGQSPQLFMARNLMVPSADDGSSIACTSIPIPVQQPSQSSKKMARSKAASSSIISPAQAELSMITFVDRPPLNATNFNVPPGQSVSFPGQILNASNQVRRQGHSQQSAQMKVAGPPLSTTSGTSTLLTAMARNQGQLSKIEQFALDTVPTSSRASPASSITGFSSSILSSPPASKLGVATLSKTSSAKDSYSHQQKASSVAAPEKKTLPQQSAQSMVSTQQRQ